MGKPWIRTGNMANSIFRRGNAAHLEITRIVYAVKTVTGSTWDCNGAILRALQALNVFKNIIAGSHVAQGDLRLTMSKVLGLQVCSILLGL